MTGSRPYIQLVYYGYIYTIVFDKLYKCYIDVIDHKCNDTILAIFEV